MTLSGSSPARLKVSSTSTSYRAKVSACGLSTSSKRASRICCTRKTDVAARMAAAGPNRCSHVSPARSIGSNGSPSARTMRGTLPPGSRAMADAPPTGCRPSVASAAPEATRCRQSGRGCGRRRLRPRRTGQAAAVPRAPRRPADLHRRAFRGSSVVATGRLTRNELRSTAWRRLFRDVYVCSCVSPTHATRAIAAAGTLLPGSVVTGRSAAVLWGVDAAVRGDDVELTVPPGSNVTAVRGVRVRRRALAGDAVTVRRGVRVTTPVVTALDIAREPTLEDSVVLLDRLVSGGVVELDAVRRAAAEASGPGSRRGGGGGGRGARTGGGAPEGRG